MLHDGSRTFGGNLSGYIRPDIQSLLDDFMAIVCEKADSAGIRRAVVRSMLPCNVVVYENDEGSSTVAAIDPEVQLGKVGREDLVAVAREVKARLSRVLASIEAAGD